MWANSADPDQMPQVNVSILTGWNMLKNFGQVGSEKSSPIFSIPLADRKIPMGDPREKQQTGLKSRMG